MKNITLQLKDIQGDVLNEENLIIGDGDKLIATFDNSISRSSICHLYEVIKTSLEDDSKLLAIPEGVKLQVLSKQ